MARALMSVIIIAFVFAITTPISFSIPFIVVPGLTGHCERPDPLTKNLSDWSGSRGYCMEIGDGSCDSAFMSIEKQIDIICQKVKEKEELKEGYNIVAISQGTLIARGLIEFCDGAPPVRNFVSLNGPQAGTASLPNCLLYGQEIGQKICLLMPWNYSSCVQGLEQEICSRFAEWVKKWVYTDCLQDRLAPSGYLKIPTAIPEYLKGSRFLPKLNNEHPDKRNSIYKERFSSLNTLVLIMADNDTVLIPKETSWFGYYQDGGFKNVLLPQNTTLYQEDWIGLKKLDDEGRVKFIRVAGGHVEISQDDIKKYIVPYLVDESAPPILTKRGGVIKSQDVFI